MFYQQLRPDQEQNDADLSNKEDLGLGLFITKQIIQANGGHIDFISFPDKGSTFVFTFDLNEMSSS